jgi:transposase
MPNGPAPALMLRDGDREELLRLTRASTVRAGLAQRARIVLMASDGVSNTSIAEQVGVSRPTVISWRDRYQAKGVAGLHDENRSGRPREIDRSKVIAVTLRPPPRKYGVTHWSSRLLARHLKISDHAVASIWREYGVQPWRSTSFRFSTDPARGGHPAAPPRVTGGRRGSVPDAPAGQMDEARSLRETGELVGTIHRGQEGNPRAVTEGVPSVPTRPVRGGSIFQGTGLSFRRGHTVTGLVGDAECQLADIVR